MLKKNKKYLLAHPYYSTFFVGLLIILTSVIIKCLRPYSGLAANLFTEALGMIIGIILIGIIFEKHNDQKEKTEEKKKILRIHKVLKTYINQYIISFYCVVTPVENRNFNEIKIPIEFNLADMQDLHKSSLLIRDFLFGETIEKFYQIELIIRNYLVQSISNIDFKYFPAFEKIFLEFIEVSIGFDARDSILNAKNVKFGDETVAENIQKLLKSGTVDKFYMDLINKVSGTEFSNAMHPYVYLYEMLKTESVLIGKYFEEIKII